jgi:DNA-binding transcriptional LysR family regulator
MRAEPLTGIVAFVAVAERSSFTAAAAQLGVSPSAVSHAVRELERRLGIRLLGRSTRSVGLTEAGERYLARVRPALEELRAAAEGLGELRDRPTGRLRLDLSRPAYFSVLAPRIAGFLQANPEIRLELALQDSFSDIVAEGNDAGIRLGEALEQDMMAVPVSGDLYTVIAAAPGYFARRPPPETPGDLVAHDCIAFRFPTSGKLYAWEFERDGRPFEFTPSSPVVTVNDPIVMRDLALAGLGVGYFISDMMERDLTEGRLVRVLEAWSPRFPGYFLYHASRRHPPAKLRALIEALRV